MGERRPPTTRLYTVRLCHRGVHTRAVQRQARVPLIGQRVEQASTIIFQHAEGFSEPTRKGIARRAGRSATTLRTPHQRARLPHRPRHGRRCARTHTGSLDGLV